MLITKYQDRSRKSNLEVIKRMKLELVRLGYKPHEVDRMIRIAGGNYPVRALSGEQVAEVEKVLDNQLKIANKYFS